MTNPIKYELIEIFLTENRYEDRFTVFGDCFIIKKHDGTKATIGTENEHDYQIDEFAEAINTENVKILITFFDDIDGVVTQYIDEDNLMHNGSGWVAVVLNSEGKEFLLPANALEDFDGRAYDIHENVLDDFWRNERDEMKSDLEEAAASLVDVYNYKGKDWYITPSINYGSIRLPYLEYGNQVVHGVIDVEFAHTNIDVETKKAAKRCLEILQRYKNQLELNSVPYLVNEYLEKKYRLNVGWDNIVDFVYKEENTGLCRKLMHEALADRYIEKEA